MILKVKIHSNQGQVREESFFKRKVEVGRLHDNDLVIDDETISGRHCSIIQEQGIIKIIDHNSLNGIIYNNEVVAEARIQGQGEVKLGECTIYLEIDTQDRTREIDLEQFIDKRKSYLKFPYILSFSFVFLTLCHFWLTNYHSSNLKALTYSLANIVVILFFIALGTIGTKLFSRKFKLIAVAELFLKIFIFALLLELGLNVIISIHPSMNFLQPLTFSLFGIHFFSKYLILTEAFQHYKKVFAFMASLGLLFYSGTFIAEKIDSQAELYNKKFSFNDHLSVFTPYISLKDENLNGLQTGLKDADQTVKEFREEFLEKKASATDT